MKKLKLKLDGKEMLSKEQMKKISGAYDGYDDYCSISNCPFGKYACCFAVGAVLGCMCFDDWFTPSTPCNYGGRGYGSCYIGWE